MSEQTGKFLQKTIATLVAILMLGIFGMFVGVSGADNGGTESENSATT